MATLRLFMRGCYRDLFAGEPFRTLSPMTQALLRMRDVCARTGLARSTIHHYIREGVLPQPTKTGRNTALYDEEFVQRAQLVKTLQERAHLPLSRIKEAMARMPEGTAQSIDLDRVTTVAQSVADALRLLPGREMSKAEMSSETGLSAGELDGLSRASLIDRGPRYSALDARIASAYARLRQAGASVDRGFAGSSQIVRAYRKYLDELAKVEAREMLRVMPALAGMSTNVDEFVRQASEPLGEFIVALHQKALVKAIAAITNGKATNGKATNNTSKEKG
jgi:DNA-binding transcriptional MerR regulator